ncbi:hypothetical protein D3C71_1600270 [compost metagenome]
MTYLYRGVTKRGDEELGGVLQSRGRDAEIAIMADGQFNADGTATAGMTVENAARAHQIMAGLYGGSCMSFTKSIEVALDFATNHFSEPGYIYTVDASDIQSHGIDSRSFADPRHPAEEEVTLIQTTGGPIPAAVIVSKVLVDRDGRPYREEATSPRD